MSSTAAQKNLIKWLDDAHAMETQSALHLERIQQRLENYPRLQQKINEHYEQTLGQKRLIEGCLDRLHDTPSSVKDLSARISAAGQFLSESTSDDEVIQEAINCYQLEQREIASYIVLIEAAKTLGDQETQGIAEVILAQEMHMANWLLEHIPELTHAFLARSAANPETAKR